MRRQFSGKRAVCLWAPLGWPRAASASTGTCEGHFGEALVVIAFQLTSPNQGKTRIILAHPPFNKSRNGY